MLTAALFSHSRYLCGAERMLLNLALLMERTGAVRPVLLVPGEGELTTAARREGIACRLVPQPPWYLLPPGDLRDYCRGVRDCREALKKTLVDINSDIVVVNTMTNVPAMLAAVDLDLPSVLWVHGVIDSLLVPERSSEFATPHDELLLHSATRVIALSNYTSDFCSRVMRRQRLDVVHNWTPVEPDFVPAENKYHSRQFICLNTFDPHKGHETLLDAAALLKKRGHLFEIHLYGDGQVRGEMERRTAELGLGDYIRFRGRTTEVERVYDESLCLLNPAQVEPFGMTLIEAMARKTPVIATRSGGPEDIVVDGETGSLVDRGDAMALADRMATLLQSPELARSQGEAGHRRVLAKFHEDTARASLLPLIEEAVRDFRGYEPAVRALSNIYQLWIAQSPTIAAPTAHSLPAIAAVTATGTMDKATRLARAAVRRTRSLAKRMSALAAPAFVRFRHPTKPGNPAANTAANITNSLSGPLGAKASEGPAGKPRGFQLLRGATRYRLVPRQGNWAGIDLLVTCDPRSGNGRLRLNVRSAAGQVVREAVGPLADCGEAGWLGFRFPPIANAAGLPFDVEITAEGSAPASAVSICESDASQNSQSAIAAKLALPWHRKALYCTTWHS
jgi:glycosyltransferase involved in cell wall biosynthesis